MECWCNVAAHPPEGERDLQVHLVTQEQTDRQIREKAKQLNNSLSFTAQT